MKPGILIADDEKDLVDLLGEVFSEEGFEVYLAYDGKMAQQILADRNVDVVVSDMRMPNLNGLQLLSLARSKCPDIHFYFISGYHDLLDNTQSLGANGVFVKPFSVKLLARSVIQTLNNERPDLFAHS